MKKISIKISRNEAGFSESGGHMTLNPVENISISPGERVSFCIELLEGLVVTKEGESVSFQLYGGNGGGNPADGISPEVHTVGDLKLVWGNGGVRGISSQGIITGFWINLVPQFTPQVGNKIKSIDLSFEVPKNMLNSPLNEKQTLVFRGVTWKNISTPKSFKIIRRIFQIPNATTIWMALAAIGTIAIAVIEYLSKDS